MVQSKVAQHLVTALENLRKERSEVEGRIATLEKLLSRQSAVEKAAAKGRTPKKRGRPPGVASATRGAKKKVAKAAKKATRAAGKKKPNWTPAARAAARERMRKYWADRRKK